MLAPAPFTKMGMSQLVGGEGANLGQHTTAVSPGSRAARKMSRYGSKKPRWESVGIASDWLNAPEMMVDVGLSLAAAPTVAQPAGQTSPGEWYTMIMPAFGLLPSAEESMDRMTEPEGLQSADGRTSHFACHWKKVGSVTGPIAMAKGVEHDAGAVNVVVSGPLFVRV